jgi:uncharacterized protein
MNAKRKFVPEHFDLRLKRSRTGRGVYAGSPIRKGACIIEYTGRPATKKQIRENRGKYLFWTSATTMIDGNIPSNLARFINHSCVPNCEIEISRKRIFVFAKRPILAGEELTYDYGTEYFDMHIKPVGCRCFRCEPE